jgi:hypothetical protein
VVQVLQEIQETQAMLDLVEQLEIQEILEMLELVDLQEIQVLEEVEVLEEVDQQTLGLLGLVVEEVVGFLDLEGMIRTGQVVVVVRGEQLQQEVLGAIQEVLHLQEVLEIKDFREPLLIPQVVQEILEILEILVEQVTQEILEILDH